jgi:hypothetical protein
VLAREKTKRYSTGGMNGTLEPSKVGSAARDSRVIAPGYEAGISGEGKFGYAFWPDNRPDEGVPSDDAHGNGILHTTEIKVQRTTAEQSDAAPVRAYVFTSTV